MAKEKFNLTELLNQRSKEIALTECTLPETAKEMEKTEKIFIDIYDIIPSKDNFYNVEKKLDWLKQSIELVGLIEPLAVKPERDKYKLISGHRRRLAILALVEEGKERFRKVECSVKEVTVTDKDKLLNRLAMIMANGYRDKTDWERMTEAIETEELVKKLKEAVHIEGRTRDLLAEILNSTAAQVGRYKAIYNNLIPDLMEEFKQDNIKVSVTYEASGLSEEYQKKVLELCRNSEDVTIREVQKLKKQEKKATPLQEKTDIQNYENQKEIQEQESEEYYKFEKQEQELEEFDPQPETVISLCYSCLHYTECHEKKSTVKECNNYMNKQESEKTAEQKYDEEQRLIDKQTKRRLEEMEDEEKMDHLPSDERQKYEIKILPEYFKSVCDGSKTFELRRNDRDYKVKDILILQEYDGIKFTGHSVKAEVTYLLEGHEGISEGYCIMGIKVISVPT